MLPMRYLPSSVSFASALKLSGFLMNLAMLNRLTSLRDVFNRKFIAQFGFKVDDSTFSKYVDYLHSPKDSSSLAVTRILFGLAMLFDIPDERGGSSMERRWGDPMTCHFPLLPFVQPLPLPYMAVVYAGLWLGALGITLGYKFRISAATFTTCYWYLFLAEKSSWNNHSYLFGLVALLISLPDAACYWSLDAYLDPAKSSSQVPYWNYFILKYQFFILYFMAGVKKGTAEWLTGYSVQNLSAHWVFTPFRWLLTVEQTDYLVVHWFVFMFDLTVAMWMMCSATRHAAMILCAMFHLMNSRLFRIGMFPWVCLATMPLFYPFDWPKKLTNSIKTEDYICQKILKIKNPNNEPKNEKDTKSIDDDDKGIDDLMANVYNFDIYEETTKNTKTNKQYEDTEETINKARDEVENEMEEVTEVNDKQNEEKATVKQASQYRKQRITVYLILFHILSQAFLPFSHFITKGYNNWTNGLYGYSWDMMVHTWETHTVIVTIVDNQNQKYFYVDPYVNTPNDRWTRHGDMVLQYANCLRDRLEESRKSTEKHSIKKELEGDTTEFRKFNEILQDNNAEDSRLFEGLSSNISIYVDIWCSMNGRFVQRLFDPKVDLLKTEWGPFERVPFLMPLLDEGLPWRADLEKMRRDVHSWSNYSDVIFLADFPGYEQEKYISVDLTNVTLTVLKGVAAYHPEVSSTGQSVLLHTGDRLSVHSGLFHKVLNVGKEPVFYMYTFFNNTEIEQPVMETPKLPVLSELYVRFYRMFSFLITVLQYLVQMFFSTCGSS